MSNKLNHQRVKRLKEGSDAVVKNCSQVLSEHNSNIFLMVDKLFRLVNKLRSKNSVLKAKNKELKRKLKAERIKYSV